MRFPKEAKRRRFGCQTTQCLLSSALSSQTNATWRLSDFTAESSAFLRQMQKQTLLSRCAVKPCVLTYLPLEAARATLQHLESAGVYSMALASCTNCSAAQNNFRRLVASPSSWIPRGRELLFSPPCNLLFIELPQWTLLAASHENETLHRELDRESENEYSI